jgi:hypothetical protein
MYKTLIAAVAAQSALANSVPIMGNHPGWVLGKGQTGIVVEIFFDFMCSASQAFNPVWEDTLAA